MEPNEHISKGEIWNFFEILRDFQSETAHILSLTPRSHVLKMRHIFKVPYRKILRVLASPAVLRDFIHDQGFVENIDPMVEKDPNIFRDSEPSGMEEFSGAMRFSANLSEN